MGNGLEGTLLLDAYQAGIVAPTELANFMAQIGAESGGLERFEESFRYPRGLAQIPVAHAHREGDDALDAARIEALDGSPERLAELMYGGRLGNDAPGDGYRYRGRGYIQLTGKANYAAAGAALGVDLVEHPERSAEPETAARIALWYWQNRVPPDVRQDVVGAALSINGGAIGLADRQRRFAAWTDALTPEVLRQLAIGEEPALPRHGARLAGGVVTGVPLLRRGESGPLITDLQSSLQQLGYLDTAGVDGRFGPRTEAAVARFQRDQRLVMDGVVGPATRGRLGTRLDERARFADAFQCLATATGPARGFEDPGHPQHPLYATLREALPAGTSPARVAQAAVACHLAGMRAPGDIGSIVDAGPFLVLTPGSLSARIAFVDLGRPPPALAESLQAVRMDAQRAPGAAIQAPGADPLREPTILQ